MRTTLEYLAEKLNLPIALADSKSVMTAIVVDDEVPARKLIRLLLEKEESVAVVAECKDGREAIEAIAEFEPDVVFMDVEMPSMNGVSVVRRYADSQNSPYFIFVTAYDRFAIDAFELNAVDYLVKPISKERMSAAIARASLAIRRDSAVNLTNKILEYVNGAGIRSNTSFEEPRITLKKHDTIRSVGFDEIVWVEAANQYVRIHTADDDFIMSETLGRFSKRLTDERFVRIHRSAVINGHCVERVERRRNGSYSVHLNNSVELPLARSRVSMLPNLLRLAEVNRKRAIQKNTII